MRRFAVGIVVVGLAAAVVLVARARSARSAREPLNAGTAVPVELASPAPMVGIVELAEPAPLSEPPLLHGRVVVRDALGRGHAEESGRFTLMLWSARGARGIAVDVRSGAWSVERPVGKAEFEAVSAQGFELGGRVAFGEHAPTERLPFPADDRLDLRVSWQARLELHVRGAEGELARVYCLSRSAADGALAHPGEYRPWPKDALSTPLLLDAPPRGPEVAYVGAEGYAWTRVEVPAEDAKRVIVLRPGGVLRVTFTGSKPDPGARLRVLAAGRSVPLADVAIGLRNSARFDGLSEGEIVVEAHLGHWRHPHVLATAKTEVRAGETAEVTLILGSAEPADWVVAEGTLTLPPAWELDAFSLALGLQDVPLGGWRGQVELPSAGMELVQASTGVHAWTARVQPGRYAVLVPQTGWFTELRVGPDGVHDLHFDVPPPCLVRVRVEDARGALAEVNELGWGYVRPDGSLLPGHEPFRHDAANERWEVRAAAGELLVHASRHGELAQERVTAREGSLDVTLRFPLVTGLRLTLVDGETGVAWDDRYPTLRPLEGQPEPRVQRARGHIVFIRASEAGEYLLVLPDVPGYEPLPDERVRLVADTVTEHVVRLRRK